ncbi:MAG: hypothetical protein HY741_10250 [Chloroflexi bacterium]|nr:hypothetical protein [Chloroflexota bacterium]
MFAGGIILLALAALLLVRHIQPAAVVLEARAAPALKLHLEIQPAGSFIPYYKYNSARATVRQGEDFTLARFGLDNESTPSLAFLIESGEREIEIRSLRVQTLFAAREWSPSEIAALLKPHGRITKYQIENGLLVVRSRGKGGSLRTGQDFSPHLAELEQIDNAILLLIGIGALALFGLSRILFAPSKNDSLWSRVKAELARVHQRRKEFNGRPAINSVPFEPSVSQRKMFCVRKKRAGIIALILLLFAWGCFRVFAVTAQTPLVGYANTGDFFRILACYGLRADTPLETTDPRVHGEPFSHYVFAGSPIKDACYLTSQTILIDAARVVNHLFAARDAPRSFDLHALGMVSAIALCGIVAALLLLYARVSLSAALGLAVVFALVLSDPFITLYANTFLTEFAAVLFLIASVVLAAYILITRDWSSQILFALALSLFLLGAARLQNLALPFVLVLWLILVGIVQWHLTARWKIVSGIVVVLVASVLALEIQTAQNARPGYMRAVQMVTSADAYFGALLPAMNDPLDGLHLLGLPEKCAPYIGKTWYQMQPALDDCAVAARELPFTAFLQLGVRDPWIFARLALPVLDDTRVWIIPKLGQVAGGDFATVEIAFPSLTWSISSFIHALSLPMYRALAAWLVLSAGVSAIVLAYAIFKATPRPFIELALAQWLFTAVYLYVVVTAVLGDGYFDLHKHTFLAKPVLLIGGAVGLVLIGLLVRVRDIVNISMRRQGASKGK